MGGSVRPHPTRRAQDDNQMFSLPFRDRCPLRVYFLSPSAIGARLCSARAEAGGKPTSYAGWLHQTS
eukprot:1053171-Pyramimonas_sp.AAC.1